MKPFFYTYFTTYPYWLYQRAMSCGNMAYTGIGLGLIQCQQLFWISNATITIVAFFRNEMAYYITCLLLLFGIGLYINSIAKFYYLIRLIPWS
jgi:hypothetical protein